MNNFIESFMTRIVNYRQEEYKKVLLLQLNIFLIISVLLLLKPLATSHLLSVYGVDILPEAFGWIAGGAIVVHMVLVQLRRWVSPIELIYVTHIFNLLCLAAWAYLQMNDSMRSSLSLLTYVYVNLFSLVTVTLFFQYCQSLLSIREAKRVLAQVGAGAIAGGVFGGYFASGLVLIVGNIGLILASILFILLSLLIMYIVEKHYADSIVPDPIDRESNRTLLRTLKHHHVWHIAGIIGVGVIVSKLVDYQFNTLAHKYIPTEDELTAFFGFWFSNMNVIGLLIQLFITQRIVDRIGVTKAMSLFPVLLLIGTMAILILPVLATGVLIKLLDGSLKQSIYKTTTEINIMPLPTQLRDRAKTLVDLVVDSLATGIAGIIIYMLVNKIALPLWTVSFATLLCIALWLVFIFRSRATYVKSLSQLVFGIQVQDDSEGQSARSIVREKIAGLSSKSAKRRAILRSLTKDEVQAIRAAAIELYHEEYPQWVQQDLHHILVDESMLVRKKHLELLLQPIVDLESLEGLYKPLDTTNNIVLTGALARSIKTNKRQLQRYLVVEKIKNMRTLIEKDESLPKVLQRTYMKAVADIRYEPYYNDIIAHLHQTNDNDLIRYALFAIRKSKLKALFPEVYRAKVKDELLNKWHQTLAAFPRLLLARMQAHPPHKWKKLARRIPALAYINKQSIVDYLFVLLNHRKLRVRRTALLTIRKSINQYPYLNYQQRKNHGRLKRIINRSKTLYGMLVLLHKEIELSTDSDRKDLLIKAEQKLKRNLNRSLQSILIITSMITDNFEIHKLYKSLVRDEKTESLDYLDQVLPFHLKKQVYPVAEMIYKYEPTLAHAEKYKVSIPTRFKLVRQLRALDPVEHEALIKIL